MQQQQTWRTALCISVAIHFLVGVVLFNAIHWQKPKVKPIHASLQAPVVNAEALDAKTVEREMAKIESEKKRAHDTEILRVKKQQTAAKQAEQQRQKAQQELAELKKQQAQLKAQNDAKITEALKSKKSLDELNKKQDEARKRLAKLTEQQKKAAEAAKRAQEQAQREAALAEKKQQAELAEREQAQLAKVRRERLRNVSEIDRYRALIQEAIRMVWHVPDNVDPNLVSQLLVRLAPGGDVLEVRISKSSGNDVLDRSARTAVLKASPLPVPDNAVLFDNFRELRLTVRPQGIEQSV